MNFIFHFIYGMSSFPLTNSIIFQDGLVEHQPVTILRGITIHEPYWSSNMGMDPNLLFPGENKDTAIVPYSG